MKFLKFKFAFLASMLFALTSSSFAQFDDLYYNPETDYVAVQTTSRDYDQPREQTYSDPAPASQYNENNYDDEYASRIDDYDFHYSSRIRRFNRPMMGNGFGFYDPFFVDRFHYDPFYQPGVSIYVNTGWNAFSPWNRRPWGYNRRGFGWGAGWGSPWCPTPRMGFGNPYAFNGMGMGFVRPMGFGMSPWGMNPYGGWGNTMIINNFYGGGGGFAGSDPWAMDNSYNRFSRIDNPQRAVRSVSYGPRTIGASRTTGTTTGRTRDGLNSGRSNYDQYPASRRQPSDGRSTTGRTRASDQRNAESAGRIDGRQSTSPQSSREASGRSSEATRSSRQQEARSQPQQTRRSLFNNSSRNSNSRSTAPRSSSPSRSSGVNRSSRSSSRSSGVNRPSRSSSRSSGINRSSRSSSRSSGINRSSRSSSRSSGVNRSSRSSSRSSGVNRSSRSSSRSSGVRSSGSSSRSSSSRSSRSRGRG